MVAVKSQYPEFLKKLRGTEEERVEMINILRFFNPSPDSRQDFLVIMSALKQMRETTEKHTTQA